MMNRILVAYFSASGVTRAAAKQLAGAAKADLFEIRPETPYTAADLDWTNKNSRSTVEMQNLDCRPALADDPVDVSSYDVIFLGFPIWWGREPSVIDTFIEAHALCGACVIPFCTSGGGGFTNRTQLDKLLPGAKAHKELGKNTTDADLAAWLSDLKL